MPTSLTDLTRASLLPFLIQITTCLLYIRSIYPIQAFKFTHSHNLSAIQLNEALCGDYLGSVLRDACRFIARLSGPGWWEDGGDGHDGSGGIVQSIVIELLDLLGRTVDEDEEWEWRSREKLIVHIHLSDQNLQFRTEAHSLNPIGTSSSSSLSSMGNLIHSSLGTDQINALFEALRERVVQELRQSTNPTSDQADQDGDHKAMMDQAGQMGKCQDVSFRIGLTVSNTSSSTAGTENIFIVPSSKRGTDSHGARQSKWVRRWIRETASGPEPVRHREGHDTGKERGWEWTSLGSIDLGLFSIAMTHQYRI